MPFDELENTRVSELLEDRPLFSQDDRVSKAAGYLKESREYEIFTVKENRLSFSTVRDLLDVMNPQQTRLGNVSSYSPPLGKNENVGRAAQLMFEYRLRAVPSYSENGVAKVVSARGIVERMAALAQSKMTAGEIMTPSPVTIMADETAEKARQIMLRRSFDHLPVVKGGKPLGMLTSAHLLQHLLPEESQGSQFRGEEKFRFHFEVARIADESLLEVEPGARLGQVMETILKNRSTYVLVTLWEEVQGIITLRDLVKLLVRRPQAKTPFYIVGLPNEPFEAESAKMKMERLGTSLTRTFPFIQEIRAVVQTKESRGPKRRYEVTVSVYTPREMHSYAAQGYDLSEIFDEIAPMLKRLLSSKQSKVTKMRGASVRKSSGEYEGTP